MKMDRVTITKMAMVMSVSVLLEMAEAQEVNCLDVSGAGAPWGDAAMVVAELRITPGQCCNDGPQNQYCSLVFQYGNAAASVCAADLPYCPDCADVGNSLNIVLSQCNILNEVQGAFRPDSVDTNVFYITSAQEPP